MNEIIEEFRKQAFEKVKRHRGPIKQKTGAFKHGVSYIYFIQEIDGGPIKIGRAARPDLRLMELQRCTYKELQIIGYIKETEDTSEVAYHSLFREQHIRGEWYDNKGFLEDFVTEMDFHPCTIEEFLSSNSWVYY